MCSHELTHVGFIRKLANDSDATTLYWVEVALGGPRISDPDRSE